MAMLPWELPVLVPMALVLECSMLPQEVPLLASMRTMLPQEVPLLASMRTMLPQKVPLEHHIVEQQWLPAKRGKSCHSHGSFELQA